MGIRIYRNNGRLRRRVADKIIFSYSKYDSLTPFNIELRNRRGDNKIGIS